MRKYAKSFVDEPKITRASFAAECDINNIVASYAQTGIINHLPRTQPQYGDCPDIDFHEAACIAAQATQALEQGLGTGPTEIVDSEASQEVSDDPPSPPEGGATPGESGGQ